MIIRKETGATAVYDYVCKKGPVIMKASLKTRILTSAIGIPLIILILLAPTPFITVVVAVASLISLYEYYRAVGLSKSKLLCVLGYIASLVISLGSDFSISTCLVLVYAYVIILFIIMLSSQGKVTVLDICKLIFGLIYIPYFLSHIIYIRTLDYGNFYVWLVFLGAFITDSAAYFTGTFLGKHKLCPKISPNKTIEGAIGGVVGGGIFFVLYGIIINSFFSQYLDGKSISLILIFILGLCVSVISQVGDLVASSIKRQFEIKDYGNIFPGHGGMLDRCDSIILVAPTIFLFLYNINIMI